MNIENNGNQLVGRTKEQMNIDTIANTPAGFQVGLANRHNPIVNKNGNATRKK